MEKKKIFLAAPFDDYMRKEASIMHESKITLIQRFIKFLEDKNYEVYNAHRREKWGRDWMGPEICTPLDFEKIKKADLFIAIPGSPPSGGVHVELGWASALEKRIIILLEKKGHYSNLILGLNKVGKVDYIICESIDKSFSEIEKIL